MTMPAVGPETSLAAEAGVAATGTGIGIETDVAGEEEAAVEGAEMAAGAAVTIDGTLPRSASTRAP